MTTHYSEEIRFLHISDLHMGMKQQNWLWPTFKNVFFDDIRKMAKKVGGWDVVVFSGDLTQSGTTADFDLLTKTLVDVWKLFRELGCNPVLFPVPGNHDLVRPDKLNSTAIVLEEWWEKSLIHEEIFKNENTDYRKLINKAFLPYSEWVSKLAENDIPMPTVARGIMPGDASAVIEIRSQKIGLVGLNSAWLHLGDSNYEGRLHVDARQLLAVTEQDADGWCKSNDYNLLITHHPISWLHADSIANWRSEINTRARFDSHLFGHMHVPTVKMLSEAGGHSQTSMQSSSLFGLERIANTRIERIHGYSSNSIFREGDRKTLRFWPRLAKVLGDGTRKIIPNHDFHINDEGYFDQDTIGKFAINNSPKADVQNFEKIVKTNNSESILQALKKTRSLSMASFAVRKVDQAISKAALEDKRAFWLTADWGLGAEDFLRSIQENYGGESTSIYQIDLHDYTDRDAILAGVQEQFGYSFAQLCEYISLAPPCFVIFDDVPIGEGRDKDTRSLQSDVELIVNAVLEYCPNAKLIVKSRLPPINSQFKMVDLKPLDEPDTATYISFHALGGHAAATASFVSQIFSLTDGVPTRIDSALKDLQIVGISELHSLNADVAGKFAPTTANAPGLVAAIAEIENSTDTVVQRAFELLKVLTIFPHGERLSMIKRFHGAEGFYLQHVHILLNCAFIDAVDVPSIASTGPSEEGKALVVRRSVREYLYGHLPSDTIKDLNRRAIALYFGKDWTTKGIKSPVTLRFDDRHRGSWELGNANKIVLRAVREAMESGIQEKLKIALNLSTTYAAALLKGKNFRSVATLGNDLLPFLENVTPPLDLTLLKFQHAKALRMMGEASQACTILKTLCLTATSKTFRQEMLLTLSLCYQSIGDAVSASKTAGDCAAISPTTGIALQAKSIAIDLDKKDVNRDKKLQILENKARKGKSFTVANNISISRANDLNNASIKKEIIERVARQSLADGDHYNAMRAVIHLAKIRMETEKILDSQTKLRLIDAYHYLYSQRINSLFNQCHDVLWKAFETNSETWNLLRLFRHSSLIWRLRNEPTKELQYLGVLRTQLSGQIEGGYRGADQELAYFLTRAESN